MNFYTFPYDVDVNAIRNEIIWNDKLWKYNTGRQRTIYEQKDTESIALRHGINEMGKRFFDCHQTYTTELAQYFPNIMAFIDFFISRYSGECGRVAIVKLKPSSLVVPHIDVGEYYRARDRFHLVVDGIYQYTVDGETNVFSPGNLFWFDSQKTHSAENIGNENRISIIFDVKGSTFR